MGVLNLNPANLNFERDVPQRWCSHFRQLKALPTMEMIEQENFLKDHILLYFESMEPPEKPDNL